MALQMDDDQTMLPFLDTAQAALDHYPFSVAELVYLQHNSGVTFRVDCADKKQYLLKLHQSVNGARSAPVEIINARMQWLADLNSATGLPVQVPVRNHHNQWITLIHDPRRAEPVPCTVQAWVDGDPPHGDFTLTQLVRLGQVMGQLHSYSRQSAGLHAVIPAYSPAQLTTNIAALHQAVDLGLLSEAAFGQIEPVKDEILAFMETTSADPRRWGLVHGDIHHDNVLIKHDDIRIIDFDALLNAPYVYDLGVTLYHIEYQGSDARQAFLAGYQQTGQLSRLPAHWIETCMAWAAIDNLAFQISIPQQSAGPFFKKNLRHLFYGLCLKNEPPLD